MKNKKILVTGGSGYLGSHLCKQLFRNGYEVYIYDNKPPHHRYFNDHFLGDLRNINDLNVCFRKHDFHCVIHLASRIEVGESLKFPTEFWSVNVGGTINLLHAMKQFNVNNIIFSSTSSVYWPSNVPLKETDCFVKNSVYGNTKHVCEMAIEDSGINYVIFRYFNLAGADPEGDLGECHEPETHLIPTIFNKINNFTIKGDDYNTHDGTCVRDYVHVSDVADAHILALNYLDENRPSEYFNLGSGQGNSILDIINKIELVLGVKVKYTFEKRRTGDPDSLIANIDLAKEVLGFCPKHNIDSILKTAYDWHKNNR